MPRQKKKARDLTSEEIAKKLFPKKVREAVREEADSDSNTTITKDDSRE